MSIRKRKTSAGQSEEYHYEFMQDGKRHYGVCEGCTTERAALGYEKSIRETAKKLAEQKNVRALVENFRDEMTGGEKIQLTDAYDLSLQKPRRHQPSASLIKAKNAYWLDFVAFMRDRYPDIITLPNVKHNHAEAYIQYLRENGRFEKSILYKRGDSKEIAGVTSSNLSGKTINTYQQTLSEVFQLLARDAGMIDNPFTDIPKLPKNTTSREAFSEKELKLIRDNLNDFTKPLFIIAIATALREGDICMLKWSEINFETNLITRQMNKTGGIVEIPILPPLKTYLLELKQLADAEEKKNKTKNGEASSCYVLKTKTGEVYKDYKIISATETTIKTSRLTKVVEILISDLTEESEKDAHSEIEALKQKTYVLPLHAKLYQENRTGVSYRIKQFLDGLGIITTKQVGGRSRVVSIKDLHSCRHSFCYYAGMYGIPLSVVQSIVGHMSPEMTKHYSAHATREAKRAKMELLPDFMGMTITPTKQITPPEPEREQLKLLADSLPIESIKRLLSYTRDWA